MIVRLVLLSLLLASSTYAAPEGNIKGNFKLIILHNNDMHARFEQTGILSNKCSNEEVDNNKCYGGFARVAHEVRRFRKDAADGKIASVLYLNAGDTYTGTPWFSVYKDEIAAELLKVLKPDAMSLGNHEFDEGVENLEKFLKSIDFPVLAANLNLDKEPGLASALMLTSSIVKEVGGRKVGIIGYLTPETKGQIAGPNQVEFIEEIVKINEEAAKLQEAGVNIIIALGHSGFEKDKLIARNCPEVDLLIGGHSHTFLYSGQGPDKEKPEADYPTTVTQPSGKKVPVVQAYAYTKYLGYLHLEFNDDGDLIVTDGSPILLDQSVPRDKDVLELLEKYRPGIVALGTEIVGVTKVLLDGNCRRHECNLGNLIGDSFVDWYATNHQSTEFWTDAPIALIQGGDIRVSINNRQNISKEDASTVLPFQNKLEIVEITGKDLMEALEYSVHRYEDGEARGEFLQFSGVHVVYDINRPSGRRVVEAKVRCSQCQVPKFEDIKETKMYKIIMQDYLANGGDGYKSIAGKSILKSEKYDVDVWVQYLKKKSPIYASVERRIVIKQVADAGQEVVDA